MAGTTPLMCTQTPLFHVDYGVPLLASKSTDYRTSTGKYHEFVPSNAQNFDSRVKLKIKPELLDKDIALKTEWTTTYHKDYFERPCVQMAQRCSPALNHAEINYTRQLQEKIFMDPPPPRPPKLSEMKEAYPVHYLQPHYDSVVNTKCQIPEEYRALQPDINPAAPGYFKHLDIYMTENKLKFPPYSEKELAKAREDLVTFYNANGKHKGLKDEIPRKFLGHTNIYDKSVFKVEFPNRFLSRAPTRVPHSGMTTDYRSNYLRPACSDFYPYVQENGLYFPESLSDSSPWQNLSPPAMYCTESCHIGTGWPVRSVVNLNSPSKDTQIIHNQLCCTKI